MAERGRTLKVQIVGDIADIKRDLKSVDKSMSGLDKSAKSFGKTAKIAGGAIVGAFAVDTVIDFAKGAIDAASDLNESLSKSQVVFGDHADAIEAWANKSSRSVGLSKQAALEAAGTFGNLFDALKLSEDATLDMSKGAVQLAADLASFNNTGLEETLAAIQSGLVGETEPMRRFGSNLSAARVETYALAKGWAKSKAELTDAMKVQARYNLMLEDTVNASGDFARTSDGLANSQRILSAELENLQAEIGQELLPVMRDFAVFASDTLVPALRDTVGLIKEVSKHSGELGYVVSLLTGNIGEQGRAVADYMAQFDPWVRTFTELGDDLGYTRIELKSLADQMRADGKTVVDFGAYLGGLRDDLDETGDAAVAAGADIGSTFGTGVPTAVTTGVDKAEVAIESLKGTYKQAIADAKTFDREWRAAIANPEKGEGTKRALEKQMKEAMRRRNHALRTGNREAFAIADREVTRLENRLNDLEQREYTIDIKFAIASLQRLTTKNGQIAGVDGYKAAGGPVAAGKSYVVGERGPELLSMGSQAGHITPNHAMGGGGGAVYNLTVNGFVGNEAQLGQVIVRAIQSHEKRASASWRRSV